METLTNNLKRQLSEEEMENFIGYEERLATIRNERIKSVHQEKFKKLQKEELELQFNDKWFVNKTNLDIPTDVKWVLSMGQKHALPVRKENFPVLKMIADGEDFVQTLEDKEEQEMARTKLTTIIDNHINKMKLTNRDKFILSKVKDTEIFLKKNKNILIVKADKGNVTVALEKSDYDERIKSIVGDIMTYQRLRKDPTNNLQKVNNDLVEDMFKQGYINQIERKKLKTDTATAPRLYGLPKIHKEDFPLRPICSSVNSPSSELCRFVTEILKKITENSKYNVKDSIEFRSKIKNEKILDNEKLISFDVVSLFPSVPVDLAMRIIEDKWETIKEFTNMTKGLFLRILKFCIKDNRYFKYDDKIYSQRKGLPMGSPASPVVADIVMEKLLDTCIENLTIKPKFLTKYVDDLFCIIPECAITQMLTSLNNFHPSIKFTIETECNSQLPYLDTLVIRKNDELLLDWYQKPTASGRIINFFSKHPKNIIINTAKNLIERVLNISDKEFHKNNKEIIKNILKCNNFPTDLTQKLIKEYQKSNKTNKNQKQEPKIYKSITYVPGLSERLEKSKIFDAEIYRMAHKTDNTLSRLFSKTKDKIHKLEISNVVYKIPCNGNADEKCNMVYVGTTKNKLKTRLSGHKSDLKNKNIFSAQKTALLSHCASCKHSPDFDKTSVLNIENNYKRRYMLEMLQIINIPTKKRVNFKADTESLAQNYRHLINKGVEGK